MAKHFTIVVSNIRNGLSKEIDISRYFPLSVSKITVTNIRNGLTKEIDISRYAMMEVAKTIQVYLSAGFKVDDLMPPFTNITCKGLLWDF